MDHQAARLNQVHIKVDLSMEKLRKLKEEKIEAVKATQQWDPCSRRGHPWCTSRAPHQNASLASGLTVPPNFR
jgi:hypothetical protein